MTFFPHRIFIIIKEDDDAEILKACLICDCCDD